MTWQNNNQQRNNAPVEIDEFVSIEKYDKDVVETGLEFDPNIKINPDAFIYNAVIKAQAALMNPNLREGFVRYSVFIEHVEVLCDAAEMLPPNYAEDILAFKQSDDYKLAKDDFGRDIKLANKKLQLILRMVFRHKPLYTSLKA